MTNNNIQAGEHIKFSIKIKNTYHKIWQPNNKQVKIPELDYNPKGQHLIPTEKHEQKCLRIIMEMSSLCQDR